MLGLKDKTDWGVLGTEGSLIGSYSLSWGVSDCECKCQGPSANPRAGAACGKGHASRTVSDHITSCSGDLRKQKVSWAEWCPEDAQAWISGAVGMLGTFPWERDSAKVEKAGDWPESSMQPGYAVTSA